MDTDGTSVSPDVIPVGGKGLFGYSSSMAGTQVSDYAVETGLFTECSEKPQGLEISSPTSEITGVAVMKHMTVTGQVKNVGTETAGYIRIYATFFDGPDGTGDVVGVQPASVIMTLAPGESASFSIMETITDRESSYVSYVLNGESDEYNAGPVVVLEFPASVLTAMLLMAIASLVTVFAARRRT